MRYSLRELGSPVTKQATNFTPLRFISVPNTFITKLTFEHFIHTLLQEPIILTSSIFFHAGQIRNGFLINTTAMPQLFKKSSYSNTFFLRRFVSLKCTQRTVIEQAIYIKLANNFLFFSLRVVFTPQKRSSHLNSRLKRLKITFCGKNNRFSVIFFALLLSVR